MAVVPEVSLCTYKSYVHNYRKADYRHSARGQNSKWLAVTESGHAGDNTGNDASLPTLACHKGVQDYSGQTLLNTGHSVDENTPDRLSKTQSRCARRDHACQLLSGNRRGSGTLGDDLCCSGHHLCRYSRR